jgi:MATE family multidrug resistance protein
MTAAAVVFLAAPRALAGVFTRDTAVLATSVALLRVAAAFQLFDGMQGVTTGVLRGLGDTRTAMLANVVGHWLIGLPFAAFMAFGLGWGVIGLWTGLSISLTLVGIVLIAVWRRRLVELNARLEGPLAPALAAPRPELS